MKKTRNQHGALAKRSVSDAMVQGANQMRKILGMKTLERRKRNCLRCERNFESQGAFNRLCNDCRELKQLDFGVSINVTRS